ncbi:SMC-Scp complex subunit ScpB [Silvibacterium dinghuense]|uniref:SMC-Scp complex subunit ScpB n=1 Tax=Silvibacterium dinghuense TaxID=1560006 RepID=A0A4Q1S907_9BACT|nr:SMC-Scp complex subunit ScpB [Silvibacterium dinghuense]RXS93373.1 SMC-Scp complex subunit ScpB [Silvibacterium dinghuense]
MSLKAKIEAVIYAAEEPVTLAQLAAIFPIEAAEHRDARLRAEAEAKASAESAEDAAEPSGNAADGDEPAEVAGEVESEALPEADAAEEESEPAGEDAPAESEEPVAEEPESAAAEASAEEPIADADQAEAAVSEEAAPAALTPEEERRLARQRERELREEIRLILAELIAEYANDARGMEIREIAGGYRVSTKAEYHDAVRSFVKSLKPPLKLSLQALETLAVIAYKQPVTAPEVAEIRGVDSGGVLGSLVTRKLITTAGRKQVIGRPILYKTTKEFLLRFGLKDLNELPSLEEFEKMAGELAEAEEPLAENEPLPFEAADGEDSEEAAVEPVEGEAVEIQAVEAEVETEPVAEAEVRPEEAAGHSEKTAATEGTIPTHAAKPIVVTEHEEAEADLPSVTAQLGQVETEPAEEESQEDAEEAAHEHVEELPEGVKAAETQAEMQKEE